MTRDHRRASVSARATASDLLLLLWRRVPPSAVETSGNPRLLRRLLEGLDLT